MPEPELHVRDFSPPVPVVACDSSRHTAHPGDTCEEIDKLQAVVRAYFERCMAQLFAEAEHRLLYGDGTGEIRGFTAERTSIPYPLTAAEMADHGIVPAGSEPSPVERALAILAPELRRCPLYNAGRPVLYGSNWKARP